MNISKFLSLAFILVSIQNLFAGGPVKVQQYLNHKKWSFVENKGQLLDENRNTITDVKYYSHEGGVHVFCKPGMVSFVFLKIDQDRKPDVSEATGMLSPANGGRVWKNIESPKASKISSSRMDIVLIGSNPNAKIKASDQQEYYENYYTTCDANNGITLVHAYNTITYKDIYPKIDLILNTKQGQEMEYSFLVHSGGNVNDIKLKWNGVDKVKGLENGGNSYGNALGNIKESAPKSFVNGNEIESSFLKKGTNYGFKMDSYNKRSDLLIDPSLAWATYYGGNTEEQGKSVSSDSAGNVFITGFTNGSKSGIATSGAYQTSYGGAQSDAFLAKFSSSGSLSWATYFGGSGNDEGDGVCTDASGNIYIIGQTSSNATIATSGSYQSSFGGVIDAFLAKFTSSGYRIWATYYGGSGIEYAGGVTVDTSGNVYITGSTYSTNGIATSGAYQTSNMGASSYDDAFLAKFSSSGGRIWATYYGGNDQDEAYGIKTDISGNVYITGWTQSSSGVATSGAFQTSHEYGYDAFLSKFSSGGSLIWATYSGGLWAFGVNTDISGNVYITGGTYSSSGIATSGAYQTSFGGGTSFNGGDAFLTKFSSSGTRLWGTYYGGSGNDYANGISIDTSGNIYITGNSTSSSGISTTGTYQTSYNGGSTDVGDAFLAKFSSSGTLSWASYYGGSGEDEGYSVNACASGNVFVTGYTGSLSGIATSGAYQTSTATDVAFLVSFSFATTSSKVPSSPTGLKTTEITDSSITFLWDAVGNATGYDPYLCGVGPKSSTIKDSFVLNGLSPNTYYEMSVQSENSYGKSASTSCVGATTLGNIPATPTGLKATVISNSTIIFTWDKVLNATDYDPYLCGVGPKSSTIKDSFVLNGLSPNTYYEMSVQSENSYGKSASTSCVGATTLGNIPATPTGLKVSGITSTSITFYWDVVSNANGYNPYWCNVGPEGVTPNNSFTITGLLPNTYAELSVQAENSYGKSPSTSCIGATTFGPPATPTGFTASSASKSSIILNWNQVTGADYYNIFNCSGAYLGKSYSTNFTVSNLLTNSFYNFKIYAENSYGLSSFTQCSGTTTGGGGSAPSTPTGLTANAASSSSINLNWSNVSGAAYYAIYTCSGVYITNTPTNSYTLTNLIANTNYSFKVLAMNSYGSSGYSNCASATTNTRSSASYVNLTSNFLSIVNFNRYSPGFR